METAALSRDIETSLADVPVFDVHTHLDATHPSARGLHDIYGERRPVTAALRRRPSAARGPSRHARRPAAGTPGPAARPGARSARERKA